MIKPKILTAVILLILLTTIELAPRAQTIAEDCEYTSFSAEGLDPTRFELLKTCIQDGTFRKVDSILVVKNGKILVEEYFNGYDRDKLHEIRSATKSLGSALMGIAIDQGKITGVKDKLYAYFQEYEPFQRWDVRKNEITLENVLNMTTGLDCNDMDNSSAGNETNVLEAADIVRFMLDLSLVYEPGEHWAYSTGSAHLIGAVIERAAGISVQEFARTYLFEPLNITQYNWKTTGGIAHTGGGFWIRPIDMAKFGQLYLNKGHWHGQKVISEEWINESSKIHVEVTDDFGYGYLWWKRIFYIDGRPFPAFSAQGNGENHIFVFPDLELVVVLTGSAYGGSYGPAQTSMMMNKYILPAVVQDIDSHQGEPKLKAVPKALFALCAVLLISALILWPIGFIIRRIRAHRVKDSKNRGARLGPGIARILSGSAALIILCFIALFLADSQLLNLFLNSGMSHPLGILEVFLGTKFITIIAVIVWVILLLALAQAVFLVLAYRNKWWTVWQRWHYTAVTLAACSFVIVMLLLGFGRIPS
jgi:CubicO group peptidase (beta-lactamase class C family)